jgi:sugar phosphate isomerase/epimerase
MTQISRRNLLLQATAAVTGLGFFEMFPPNTTVARSGAAGPDIKFPSRSPDRIAVSTWSFREYIAGPGDDGKVHAGMSLVEFAADVRRKFGVPNIEPWNEHLPRDARSLEQLRKGIESAGCHVANLAVGERGSYYDPDPAARRAAVEARRKWVDVATTLECSSIRTNMGRPRRGSPDVQLAADSLRRVTDYAARKNVVVNLENDDLVSEDPFFIIQVIERVNSPYLRALPDFCNSMTTGNADFNYRGVRAMFAHAFSICHVRRQQTGDDGRVYTIDLQRSFDILKESGFRGYCSMEWAGGNEGVYDGTRELVTQTMKYLS